MKIDYDKFLTAAEKVHIHVLRFVTALLTMSMWLLVLGGGFVSWHLVSYGLRLSGILLVILFLLVYGGFQLLLVWMLCRRLRIAKRIAVWIFIWVPAVNLFLALYVRGLARQEIDHTLYKIDLDDVRAERQICSTRYPLLLVHGVGFRDFHYFNYWGRIPRELKRNGARGYYGHQEAWGTVESNALILKEKIRE